MQTRGVIISTSQMVTKIRWYDVPRDKGKREGAGRERAKRWSWVTRLPWPWPLFLAVPAADLRAAGFPSAPRGEHMTGSSPSSCSSPAVALPVDFCWAVPGSCLPRKYLLLVGSTKEIFRFRLADVVLMHIWQSFLCFNIMIWKLFTLDVYSCCWV